MNLDYEKLGEVLDKFVLNWPHGGTHDDHMVCCEVAAKQVIAASGLLEEVERLTNQLANTTKCAIEMITENACERHNHMICGQSFHDFSKDEKEIGCKRCLKEEVERLRATVERVKVQSLLESSRFHLDPDTRSAVADVVFRFNQALKGPQ